MQGDFYIVKSGPLMSDQTVHNKKNPQRLQIKLSRGCASYVPTREDEVGAVGIVSSWVGGFNGRMVINRILDMVDELLSIN
jgi:hypothetical protein